MGRKWLVEKGIFSLLFDFEQWALPIHIQKGSGYFTLGILCFYLIFDWDSTRK